jgi:uncharacterized protein involved in outer membrane biogenesis
MKKIVVVLLGFVFLALLVAFVFGFVMLGSVVKASVEKVGPFVLKVPVKLDSANVSVFNGKGELHGFEIGNPEGFKSAKAIHVGSVAVAIQPKSVMAEKVVIPSIRVVGPEIIYETDLKGSNLSKILDNVKEMAGTGAATNQPGQSGSKPKKLQVDEFVITGGKISVAATMLGGKGATLPLPEIRLSNLGQGPEGITPAELTEKAMSAILAGTVKAVAEGGAALAKQGLDGVTSASTNVVNKAGAEGTKALQKVGDMFKKK